LAFLKYPNKTQKRCQGSIVYLDNDERKNYNQVMQKRLFLKLFFLFLFFSLFFLKTPLQASDEFFIETKITYRASFDAKMKVNHEVSLTNKLSNVYAQEYSFTIEGASPTNLYAWDELGSIDYQAFVQPDETKISLPFNQEVVGKDKTLHFGLSYNKDDLLKKTGDVWEVTIPKFVNSEKDENLNVILEVPKEFGHLAFISPTPISQEIKDDLQTFLFNRDQVSKSGVIAAFGEYQTFVFEINYHLQNSENKRVKTEVALPPDTNYQKMYYDEIEPQPENVVLDKNGNWLAQYILNPKQNLEIKAQGLAKVFAKPYRQFAPPADLKIFLQPTNYWPTENNLIKEKAKNLKNVEEIYQFVVNSLTYDYSRVREGAERLGALKALEEPDRATCMEFTDLFVTLARAANIPAREVNGYAYTTNPQLRPLSLVQDVLHSWPEYWDEKAGVWVQVDPTWQNTTGGVDYFHKLDLGHFSFVIHGEEDDYPYPAGAYKTSQKSGKDIIVNFGQFHENEPEEKIDLLFEMPELIASELKTKGDIKVLNDSAMALYDTQFKSKSEEVNLVFDEENVAVLPPFSYQKIPFILTCPHLFKTGSAKIIIEINDQIFEKIIRVESLLLSGLIVVIATISFSLIALYLILKIRRKKLTAQNRFDKI
jgi:transglutaminase-like putative cysteine protease